MLASDFADLVLWVTSGEVSWQGKITRCRPISVPGFSGSLALIAAWQGPHQVFQKSTSTTLPPVERDDGVRKLVEGHVGRLFDLHLAFQRRQPCVPWPE